MSGTINQGMEISGASASGTPPDIELAEMPGVLDQEMEASASSATELATDTEPAEVPSPTPKLIFLCSPNNPTGNLLNREDVLKVLEMAEGKSIVILDEAYIEFNPEASFINDLTEYDNLVVARTLSKAFGLAGLRTGFLIANPEIISILQKVSAPYPIPVPIVEMATEALNNEGVSRMKSEVKAIIQSRSTLEAALNDLEFVKQVYPGDANFLLLEVADVQEVMNYLKSRGIIIRDQSHQLNLENCIRISIGTEAEQAELLKVLKNYGEQA
jgi:histidinol-phosphate aminotransferase